MARGIALSVLIEMFRAEVGQSTTLSVGTDSLPHVKQLLRRTQNTLYHNPANDWAFLRVFPTKALVAGSRYYDAPADLNIDRIEEMVVIYDNEPLPITRGIGFNEYATHDPEDDERQSPVENWDLRWTGTKTQIEVWPLPASAQTLMAKCLRPLRSLIELSDVCDLDADLIVLFAAAEELASQGDEAGAKIKLTMAQQLLGSLKAGAQSASPTIQLGLGGGSPKMGVTVRVT